MLSITTDRRILDSPGPDSSCNASLHFYLIPVSLLPPLLIVLRPISFVHPLYTLYRTLSPRFLPTRTHRLLVREVDERRFEEECRQVI